VSFHVPDAKAVRAAASPGMTRAAPLIFNRLRLRAARIMHGIPRSKLQENVAGSLQMVFCHYSPTTFKPAN